MYSVEITNLNQNKTRTHTFESNNSFNLFISRIRRHMAENPLNDMEVRTYDRHGLIHVYY